MTRGLFPVRAPDFLRFKKKLDVITTQGDVIRGDSSGNPERLALGASGTVIGSDGTDTTYDYPQAAVTGESKGLVITNNSGTPTAQVDVDADEIVLKTADGGKAKVASSVNLTADLTASGANGLDTGAEASDTHYYVWVIWDSANDTTASLLSLSATAPTMPGTYDYKALVGAVYNDSGGDLLVFEQHGKIIWTKDTPASWQALNAGAATTPTAVDLSAFVPAIVNDVQLWVQVVRSTAAAGGYSGRIYGDSGGSHQLSNTGTIYDGTQSLTNAVRQWYPLLTAQTIYYDNNAAGVSMSIFVAGFRMP